MSKSTKVPRSSKPKKPYPGFPLTPHPSGRWCKKIRGKLHYFGHIDNPDAALEKLNREWPALREGRTPPPVDTGEGCTVQVLCNAFLTSKKRKLDAGELSERSFRDYFKSCKELFDHFGRDRRVDDLRPDDFERSSGRSWLIASARSQLKTKSTVAVSCSSTLTTNGWSTIR